VLALGTILMNNNLENSKENCSMAGEVPARRELGESADVEKALQVIDGLTEKEVRQRSALERLTRELDGTSSQLLGLIGNLGSSLKRGGVPQWQEVAALEAVHSHLSMSSPVQNSRSVSEEFRAIREELGPFAETIDRIREEEPEGPLVLIVENVGARSPFFKVTAGHVNDLKASGCYWGGENWFCEYWIEFGDNDVYENKFYLRNSWPKKLEQPNRPDLVFAAGEDSVDSELVQGRVNAVGDDRPKSLVVLGKKAIEQFMHILEQQSGSDENIDDAFEVIVDSLESSHNEESSRVILLMIQDARQYKERWREKNRTRTIEKLSESLADGILSGDEILFSETVLRLIVQKIYVRRFARITQGMSNDEIADLLDEVQQNTVARLKTHYRETQVLDDGSLTHLTGHWEDRIRSVLEQIPETVIY
jgi:hypothetical protein